MGYDLGGGSIQFNYRYNNVSRLYLNDSMDRAPDYLRVDYNGKTHFAELYGNYRWKNVELLAGADYRHHQMSSDLLAVSMFGPFTTTLPDSKRRCAGESFRSVILNNKHLILRAGEEESSFEYGKIFYPIIKRAGEKQLNCF